MLNELESIIMVLLNRSNFLAVTCLSIAQLSPVATYAAEADLEPIAVQTGELISQIEFGLQVQQAALLVRYVKDGQIPEADQFDLQWDELLTALEHVAEYSVRLIEIAEEPDAENSQDRLAVNLRTLYEALRSLPTIGPALSGVDLATIEKQTREAKNFVKAARAVHQGIDPAVAALYDLIDDAADMLDAAGDRLVADIDAYHADTFRYRSLVARNRNQIFRQLEMLDRAYVDNDQAAWDELLAADRELRQVLKNDKKPSVEAIDKAQQVLMRGLAKMDVLRASLEPDMALYQAELLELRDVSQSFDSALRVARLSVGAWDTGHQMFAEGRKTGFALITSALMNYAVDKGRRKVF